ncbi:hypothetical protein BX666DRAFT_1886116 [Dichotomocladium elegans]|nr:hypothetical protein BX666DRAFT_1886116 [Dichotomocladium elegans]
MTTANYTSDDDADFDPFADLSHEEIAQNEVRQERMHRHVEHMLNKFSNDPRKRTTQENRMVFHHSRLARFQEPQKITGLLTIAECDAVMAALSDTHNDHSSWTTDRHSAFPTTDIPIINTPFAYLADVIRSRLFSRLGAHFGFDGERDLAFRDIFIVKYRADAQSGLRSHTDGCLISFNVLLNSPAEFEGGGTWFASTNTVVTIGQGDCVFHDARIMHKGVDIVRGERFILVGFIDTVDTIAKDSWGKHQRRQD